MLELLKSLWGLVAGLLEMGLDLVVLVVGGVSDLLAVLHGHPLLEGLLVGIMLSWVLLRRDKHPLLRVLSAPLKLVVDILDLAWDQGVEIVGDLWGTGLSWVKKVLGWGRSLVVGAWNKGVGLLRGIRDRLSRKSD